MSNTSSTARALTITSVIAAVSLTGYAVYFDYKRRSNPEFRKQLKHKLKKQAEKEKKEKDEARQIKLELVSQHLSKDLASDPISINPADREKVFTSNVELGERLSMSPGKELESAVKFYKALSVYPNPADLLGIYQRSVPEAVYEYIVMMIAVLPPANISTFLSGSKDKALAQEAELAAMAEVNEIVE